GPLLRLALTLAAPAAARSEAPAPGGEPSRPATAFGPEVPRGAMARFLAACREGHYARAAEYLNLRQLPQAVRAQRGPELARELETVLDRALWVDLDRLSDQPEGDPEDGLPALRDSLGTIETATGPVEVLIERVSQPGRSASRSVSRSSPRASASSRSRCPSSASSSPARRRSRSSRPRGSSCAVSTSSWRASSDGSTSPGTSGRWRPSRSAAARSRCSSRWS